jgi:uncharacterized protein YjgD (DUF1641 family)
MANPIAFKPPPVDPRKELTRRLESAPTEHAEALLVVWDILQSAHDTGTLDAVHGLMVGRDAIAGKLAEYAKLPESTNGIRNLISLMKIAGALEPETLERLAKSVATASEVQAREAKPPSLWCIFRRGTNEDSRRGLSFLTLLIESAGQALKRKAA